MKNINKIFIPLSLTSIVLMPTTLLFKIDNHSSHEFLHEMQKSLSKVETSYDSLSNNDKRLLMNYYLSNLQKNTPKNQYGSCAYVATTMLFSFYDTFISDSIMDSSYEVNTTMNAMPGAIPNIKNYELVRSPGVFDDTSIVTTMSRDGFRERYKKDPSVLKTEFNTNLISLSDELGNIPSGDLPATQYVMMQASRLYLNRKGFIEGKDYQFKSISGKSHSENMKFVKEAILNGNPVAITVNSKVHMMVAYDYDEQKDQL